MAVTFEGVEQKIKIKCNHDGRFFLAIDSQPQLDRQRYEDTMLSLDGVRLMCGWTIFYRRRGWYTVQRRVWCIGLTYEFNSYHRLCHYYRQAIATALLSLLILHGYVKSPRVSSFALQILPASHFVRGHMMCTKNIWLQDIHYIRVNLRTKSSINPWWIVEMAAFS